MRVKCQRKVVGLRVSLLSLLQTFFPLPFSLCVDSFLVPDVHPQSKHADETQRGREREREAHAHGRKKKKEKRRAA